MLRLRVGVRCREPRAGHGPATRRFAFRSRSFQNSENFPGGQAIKMFEYIDAKITTLTQISEQFTQISWNINHGERPQAERSC